VVRLSDLGPGDLVRVRAGAFENLRGVVEWVERNARSVQLTLKGLFQRDLRTAVEATLLDHLERPQGKRYTLETLPVRRAS
jgi:transcription antitermination factor NusG